MFLGEYQHSLDAKGRIILPSKFRARLAQGCVLTEGQEPCLYVYPREEWERVAAGLREASASSKGVRDFTRVFFSGSSEDLPDAQGRIGIPEHLRDHASLEREVAVIGNGHRCEIWDRAVWERYRREAKQGYSEIAEGHPDLRL